MAATLACLPLLWHYLVLSVTALSTPFCEWEDYLKSCVAEILIAVEKRPPLYDLNVEGYTDKDVQENNVQNGPRNSLLLTMGAPSPNTFFAFCT